MSGQCINVGLADAGLRKHEESSLWFRLWLRRCSRGKRLYVVAMNESRVEPQREETTMNSTNKHKANNTY